MWQFTYYTVSLHLSLFFHFSPAQGYPVTVRNEEREGIMIKMQEFIFKNSGVPLFHMVCM